MWVKSELQNEKKKKKKKAKERKVCLHGKSFDLVCSDLDFGDEGNGDAVS